jgi:DNA-binding MarR family transcriptional regulator
MSAQATSAEASIELSAADAREIARLLALLLKGAAPSNGNLLSKNVPSRTPQDAQNRSVLAAKARAIFSERNRRSQHFSPAMFGELGWDMLLALYITDFAGGRQTVGQLVSLVGAPPTSALRWIDYLEKERLISRESHPRDRRTVLVSITNRGRQKLDEYLSTLPFLLSG